MKWIIAKGVIAGIAAGIGYSVLFSKIPSGWQAITWILFAAWIIMSFMRIFDEDNGCGGQIIIFLLEFALPFVIAGLPAIGDDFEHLGLFICTDAMIASVFSEIIVAAIIDNF